MLCSLKFDWQNQFLFSENSFSEELASSVCNFYTAKLLFRRNNRIWLKNLVCKSSNVTSNQVIEEKNFDKRLFCSTKHFMDWKWRTILLASNTLRHKFFPIKICSLQWNGAALTCKEQLWRKFAGEYQVWKSPFF